MLLSGACVHSDDDDDGGGGGDLDGDDGGDGATGRSETKVEQPVFVASKAEMSCETEKSPSALVKDLLRLLLPDTDRSPHGNIVRAQMETKHSATEQKTTPAAPASTKTTTGSVGFQAASAAQLAHRQADAKSRRPTSLAFCSPG